ncbi:hypothetical protein [Sulfitobacter sp. JB4-11]|uniref:hypothetical protein n=1 Tax=Sulfitobacter rhodophyticola TaxID=3238304 RepID=UPI00351508C4
MDTPETSVFDIIIWTGAALSLLGLVGLIWCIVTVSRAKRQDLSDEDMRAVLKKALPLNLGALFLSVIGLMMVIIGIFLA